MEDFLNIYHSPEGGGGGTASVPQGGAEQKFHQLADELKNLVKTANERGEAERSEYEERINKRLDDLDHSFQTQMEALKGKSLETKGFQHLESFKKALFRFAKSDRHGLESQVSSGDFEVKAGYHPNVRDTKSDNIVRFDVTTGGALLMPGEISDQLLYNAIESTPVARLVNTTTTSNPTKTRTIRVGTPGLQWIEEEGTVSKGKMTYRKVTLTPKQAAARYGMTIQEEQDTAHDLMAEINRAYQDDFAVGIGTAVMKGGGVDRPTGMIGAMTGFDSGGQALTANMLIDMQESCPDDYQENANWLFTRKTRANIRKLFLTSNNAALQYLWEPDFTKRSPTLLLGRPVNIAREGDLAGKFTGDFTIGDVPVIYGDFRAGYELVTRSDMYMIDDPYSDSDSFVRNLSIMSRVDGKPMQTEALVELRITSS